MLTRDRDAASQQFLLALIAVTVIKEQIKTTIKHNKHGAFKKKEEATQHIAARLWHGTGSFLFVLLVLDVEYMYSTCNMQHAAHASMMQHAAHSTCNMQGKRACVRALCAWPWPCLFLCSLVFACALFLLSFFLCFVFVFGVYVACCMLDYVGVGVRMHGAWCMVHCLLLPNGKLKSKSS